jgi:hypothetical protein
MALRLSRSIIWGYRILNGWTLGKGRTVAIGANVHSVEGRDRTVAAASEKMAASLAAIGVFRTILRVYLPEQVALGDALNHQIVPLPAGLH